MRSKSSKTWKDLKFWESETWKTIEKKLADETFECSPRREFIFRALMETPLNRVKVVILGQDPYPTKELAHGLAFSVNPGYSGYLPASLKNIFRELHTDLHLPPPSQSDLTPWAKQGVLLWNSILTVGKTPGSHKALGWHELTKELLQTLYVEVDPIFLLWGGIAKNTFRDALSALEKPPRNPPLRLEAAHPSPLSAHEGFFGSRPFSKTNVLLKSLEREVIDWKL